MDERQPNEPAATATGAQAADDVTGDGFAASRYLAATNVAAGTIGFAVAAYVARVLGPESLGVLGIIAGINGSIAAFVDVRFNDLAGKAFHQGEETSEERRAAYRAGVLWLAVIGTALLGAGATLLSALLGNLLVAIFTPAPVSWWWIPLGALTIATNALTGTLMFLLRFARAFRTIGASRVRSQILAALVTAGVVSWRPTLGGVYAAAFAGALSGLALMLGASWRVWGRDFGLPLLRPDWRRALGVFRRDLRMIFWGNVLGYAKLLERGTDVLVVAYFTADRETGLYRLARSLVDQAMAIPQDALYQVYYPSFLELYARGASGEFRRLAARLLAIAATITAVLLAGEALVLGTLVPLVFGAAYAGVEAPMMILSATFVFIVGFHPWLWSFFVASGELGGYTAAVFTATGAHYLVMLGLFGAAGPSATSAMVGVLAYYLWLVPAACWMVGRRRPEFLPGASPAEVGA